MVLLSSLRITDAPILYTPGCKNPSSRADKAIQYGGRRPGRPEDGKKCCLVSEAKIRGMTAGWPDEICTAGLEERVCHFAMQATRCSTQPAPALSAATNKERGGRQRRGDTIRGKEIEEDALVAAPSGRCSAVASASATPKLESPPRRTASGYLNPSPPVKSMEETRKKNPHCVCRAGGRGRRPLKDGDRRWGM